MDDEKTATPTPGTPAAPAAPAPASSSPIAAATAALRTSPPAEGAVPTIPPFLPVSAPASATAGAPATPAAPEGATPAPEGGEVPPTPEGAAPEGGAPEGTAPETPETPAALEEPILVEVPSRFPDQKHTFAVSDPKDAEVLRMLTNGFMRGEQAKSLREQADKAIEAANTQRIQFLADPVAVVGTMHPEARAMVVRNLLLDQEVFKLVAEDLDTLADHGADALRDKAENSRTKHRDATAGQVAALQEREQLTRQIGGYLDSILLASGHDEDTQDDLYDELVGTLQLHEQTTGKQIKSLAEARSVIARKAQLFKIPLDPSSSAPAGATAAPPAKPSAPAKPTAPAPAAAPSVEQVRQNSVIRRVASAAAPTGRPAPTLPAESPLLPPKGSTIKDATARLRAQAANPNTVT